MEGIDLCCAISVMVLEVLINLCYEGSVDHHVKTSGVSVDIAEWMY